MNKAYSLITEVVNKAVEKGVAALLDDDVRLRLPEERLPVEVVHPRLRRGRPPDVTTCNEENMQS